MLAHLHPQEGSKCLPLHRNVLSVGPSTGRLREAEKSYKALEAKSGSAMRDLVQGVERNSEALDQGQLQVHHGVHQTLRQ